MDGSPFPPMLSETILSCCKLLLATIEGRTGKTPTNRETPTEVKDPAVNCNVMVNLQHSTSGVREQN